MGVPWSSAWLKGAIALSGLFLTLTALERAVLERAALTRVASRLVA